MKYKICNYCGITKPLEEFLWQKGKSVKCCKTCKKIKQRVKKQSILEGTYKPYLNKEELLKSFKIDATNLNGTLYNYDEVEYVNSKTNVKIYCTKHKSYFLQTVGNHLAGKRCPDCAREIRIKKKTLTTEEFIERAISAQEISYNYSKVDYVGTGTPVIIGCLKCSKDFLQKPNVHLSGSGCPNCASYGYNKYKPGSIYLLQSGDITKIGITNKPVAERVAIINRSGKNFKIIFTKFSEDGSIPYFTEWATKLLLNSLYKPVEDKFDGFTECFLDVDTKTLVKILEQHFTNMQGNL